MLRQIVILFIVAVILGKSDALCPALIRVFNGANPTNPTNIDLIVNSKIIVTGVPFGQVITAPFSFLLLLIITLICVFVSHSLG
jgi:hypothetical protein